MQISWGPFDAVFRGDDVEQRIYGTILQTREPTMASAIADQVECDPKTARKYLGWFADLGFVTRHDGHPETYERNDAYFEWRCSIHLASDHSVEELQERVRELTTRITEYKEMHDASTPAAVDAVDFAANATVERLTTCTATSVTGQPPGRSADAMNVPASNSPVPRANRYRDSRIDGAGSWRWE